MKVWRTLSGLIAFLFTLSQWGVFTVYGSEMIIPATQITEGIVNVKIATQTDKRIRIGLYATGSEEEYFFAYSKEEGEIGIPLIFGNDQYRISLYEEIDNGFYSLQGTFNVDLHMDDYNDIYLTSSVIVPWSGAVKTIAKTKLLTKNKNKDIDKFLAIYRYVVENVLYDKQKTVSTGYRSSPDATLAADSGICLDMAVLVAAMLRCAGIKCKLVYGEANDIEGYHSWNEVYINDQWIVVDPTKDSTFYDMYKSYKYSKLPQNYKGTYWF